MKYFAFVLVIFSTLFLSGCVSRRPEPTVFNEETTVAYEDPEERFELRIPNAVNLELAQEEGPSRLYEITDKDSGQTRMYVEETPSSIDEAVNMLNDVDEITQVSRERIEINGHQGTKLSVNISANSAQNVPYYFLRANDYTYVFSIPGGRDWQYFEPVIESFSAVEQGNQ